MMRTIAMATTAFAILAAAGPCLASDLTTGVIITNNTPYAIYTVTDGGGKQCIRGGLGATNLTPGGQIGFQVTLPSLCDSGAINQAIAIAAPVKEELRVDLPIGFNREVGLTASRVTLGLYQIDPVREGDALNLLVHCIQPDVCAYGEATLAVQNQTARPLILQPLPNDCYGNPAPSPFTVPANGSASTQFATCRALRFTVSQSDPSQPAPLPGDVWEIDFANGTPAPRLSPAIFDPNAQVQGQQVTVTVRCSELPQVRANGMCS